MTLEDSFYIGYISKTRGLKGEVQLFFEFKDYESLELDVVYIELNKKLVPFFVESIKLQKNSTAYLSFEDVDHIDKAEQIVRKKAYLSNTKMPQRDPDDFRLTDLVGYTVMDVQDGELGVITEIREMPQQHMATVDIGEKELLFPLSDDLLLSIDTKSKRIDVALPDGIVALYRED